MAATSEKTSSTRLGVIGLSRQLKGHRGHLVGPPWLRSGRVARKSDQDTIATLLERDDATLRGHLRETNRIGEVRSEFRKIYLDHPTGDSARASDIHRYLEVTDLRHEFPKWWEAHAVHGVDHPRLDQAGGLAQQRYAAVYLRAPRARCPQER